MNNCVCLTHEEMALDFFSLHSMDNSTLAKYESISHRYDNIFSDFFKVIRFNQGKMRYACFKGKYLISNGFYTCLNKDKKKKKNIKD